MPPLGDKVGKKNEELLKYITGNLAFKVHDWNDTVHPGGRQTLDIARRFLVTTQLQRWAGWAGWGVLKEAMK